MTLHQARAEMTSRGFTHVLTAGGPVEILSWNPYGTDSPSCRLVLRFTPYVRTDQLADNFPEHLIPEQRTLGVWTFAQLRARGAHGGERCHRCGEDAATMWSRPSDGDRAYCAECIEAMSRSAS